MNGIIVLIVYGVLMIGATLLFTKKESDTESFLVSNRKMKTLISAMSIAATWIWAPALLTSAEKAYTNGIVGLFWFLVPNVICLIIFIPFAKRIRSEMPQGITLSGYMKNKYNSNGVKNVYLMQLTGLAIFSTAVQLLAGGKILSAATGLPFWLMTIILAAIAYSYSQFSGLKADVLTDAIQLVFIIVAVIAFAICAFKIDNGIGGLVTGLSGFTGEYGSLFSKKGLEVFLSFGLPTTVGLLSGPFGDQSFWQRAFAIKQDKIGKSFGIGAVLFAIVPLLMGSIGFVAAGMGFVPDSTGTVNMEYLTHILSGWVAVPFMFMLLSGLLSTVDSNMCSISALTTDVVKKSSLKISKVSMILLLIAGIVIANIPGLTVTYLFLFYGTLRATTLLPTIMTLKGVRLTSKGIIAGVLTAFIIGLPIFGYANINNIATLKTVGSLFTVLSSGVIALIVSRLGVRKV